MHAVEKIALSGFLFIEIMTSLNESYKILIWQQNIGRVKGHVTVRWESLQRSHQDT